MPSGASPRLRLGVGYDGTIRYFNGIEWIDIPSPTTERLDAVWGSGPNYVWAAGYHGVMLHYPCSPVARYRDPHRIEVGRRSAQGLALPKTAGSFSVPGDTTQTLSSLQIDSGCLHGLRVQLGSWRSSFVTRVPGVQGPQGRVGQSAFASQAIAPGAAEADGAPSVDDASVAVGAADPAAVADGAELEPPGEAWSPQAKSPEAMAMVSNEDAPFMDGVLSRTTTHFARVLKRRIHVLVP